MNSISKPPSRNLQSVTARWIDKQSMQTEASVIGNELQQNTEVTKLFSSACFPERKKIFKI